MKTFCRRLFCSILAALALPGISGAQAQIRITEVNPSARNVEVTNFGTSSVSLTGWFFCHTFLYPALSGNIAPGESRQFTVNFNQSASDLGLYNSSVFGSAAAMQDFVQWGIGGSGRESVAVAKGIWTAGGFLLLPPSGKSFHARGLSTTGVRNGNWFVGWPHAGFPVPDMSFERITLTGGEWRITARSLYLTGAHRVDVRADAASAWQQLPAPGITELGAGRLDVRFPATGVRQFARLRAEF